MRGILHKRFKKDYGNGLWLWDGSVNFIRPDRLRKICNNCIIQRKEKKSWRKKETGRAKNGEGQLRKRKSVLQQKSPHLLPWACNQSCRAKIFASGDVTSLCFVWILGHLWPLCWHVKWYVIYHYCRVNDPPLNRNLRISNVHIR